MVLRATVNCDMGEGYSLYTIGDDESLMKTIHLANIACGFHAGDFAVMDRTVELAKLNNVLPGAHPSLPDRQGFGRREMAIEPDELAACFVYQVGALTGFLCRYGLEMNHIKPHGSVYGMTARSMELAQVAVGVAKLFNVAFMGLAGTCHQKACEEAGVKFIAEWFADLDYSPEGELLITKKHDPIATDEIERRVCIIGAQVTRILSDGLVTTKTGTVHIGEGVTNISICVHSDSPGAVEIAQLVKRLVDGSNQKAGF